MFSDSSIMSNLDHDPSDDYYEEGLPIKQELVEKPFNLAGEQEKTRAWLAKALVFIFGGTISIFLVFIGFAINSPVTSIDNVKDSIALILTSEMES